ERRFTSSNVSPGESNVPISLPAGPYLAASCCSGACAEGGGADGSDRASVSGWLIVRISKGVFLPAIVRAYYAFMGGATTNRRGGTTSRGVASRAASLTPHGASRLA